MVKAPISQTLILTEDGSVVAVSPVDIPGAVEIVPIAAFLDLPTIMSDGTPQVGEALLGVDALVANLGINLLTREWLNGSTVVATKAEFTPSEVGTFTYRNRIMLGAVVLATVSVEVIVAAAGGEASTPIPTPAISILNPGDNPPSIVIAPDTYLAGDHFALDRFTNAGLTEGFYRDDHVLTDDEIGVGDVTFASLITLPEGSYWYTGTVVRDGVSGTRSNAVNNVVSAASVQTATFDPTASFAGFNFTDGNRTVASNLGDPGSTSDSADSGRMALTAQAIPTNGESYVVEFEFTGASADYAVVGFHQEGETKGYFYTDPKCNNHITDFAVPEFSAEWSGESAKTDNLYELPANRVQVLFIKKATEFAAPTMAVIVKGKRITPSPAIFGGTPGLTLRAYVASKTGSVTIVPPSFVPAGFQPWPTAA